MIRLRFSDLRNAHPDWIIRNGAHVISWWTKSPWNHVDVVSDFSGPSLFGAMPGDGVSRRNHVRAQDEQFVDIKCTADQNDAFWNAVLPHTGKGYDYKAVIGWSAGLQDEGVWFCSEIIAVGLIAAGLMPNTKHVSPADLHKLFAS
jgi:hypothetical protein